MTNETAALARCTDTLLETLRREHTLLVELDAQVQRQNEALRAHQQDELQEATAVVSGLVNLLGRMRQTRDRQTDLLRRMLQARPEASLSELADHLESDPATCTAGQALRQCHGDLRQQATYTKKRCDVLEFALSYAVQFGKECIQSMREAPPAALYTAGGTYARPNTGTSFVNQAI